jgi:hypothetical protein
VQGWSRAIRGEYYKRNRELIIFPPPAVGIDGWEVMRKNSRVYDRESGIEEEDAKTVTKSFKLTNPNNDNSLAESVLAGPAPLGFGADNARTRIWS